MVVPATRAVAPTTDVVAGRESAAGAALVVALGVGERGVGCVLNAEPAVASKSSPADRIKRAVGIASNAKSRRLVPTNFFDSGAL